MDERHAAMKPLLDELLILGEEGRLTCNRAALAVSLIHMWMNRVGIVDQNRQETTTYRLLAKHYDSLCARQRKGK